MIIEGLSYQDAVVVIDNLRNAGYEANISVGCIKTNAHRNIIKAMIPVGLKHSISNNKRSFLAEQTLRFVDLER